MRPSFPIVVDPHMGHNQQVLSQYLTVVKNLLKVCEGIIKMARTQLECLTVLFTLVEKKEGFFPNFGSTAVSFLLA